MGRRESDLTAKWDRHDKESDSIQEIPKGGYTDHHSTLRRLTRPDIGRLTRPKLEDKNRDSSQAPKQDSWNRVRIRVVILPTTVTKRSFGGPLPRLLDQRRRGPNPALTGPSGARSRAYWTFGGPIPRLLGRSSGTQARVYWAKLHREPKPAFTGLRFSGTQARVYWAEHHRGPNPAFTGPQLLGPNPAFTGPNLQCCILLHACCTRGRDLGLCGRVRLCQL